MDDTFVCGLGFRRGKLKIRSEGNTYKPKSSMHKVNNPYLIRHYCHRTLQCESISSLAQEKASFPNVTQITRIVVSSMWIMRQTERTLKMWITLPATPRVRILPSVSIKKEEIVVAKCHLTYWMGQRTQHNPAISTKRWNCSWGRLWLIKHH